MSRIVEGLKSGKLPAILYSDNTDESKFAQRLLDKVGANYTIRCPSDKSIHKPLLVVDGLPLCIKDLRDILQIFIGDYV